MPTYEYHCDSCDKNFDVVQSFHDDALTACPTCGSPVRKVFGNVGIVFKGSGFYKTDSRNGGASKPTTGDGTTTPASEGSGGDSPGSGDSGSTTDTSPSKPSGDTPTSTSPSESGSKPKPASPKGKPAPSPSPS